MTTDETPIRESIPESLDHDLHLLNTLQVSASDQPVAFQIDDARRANWLVKKIVQGREYIQRVKLWSAQEIRRSEREEINLLYRFGKQLEGWLNSELEKLNGRRKRTISLPGGRIGLRRKAMKLVVVDEEAVKAWARENCPKAIKIVEKLSKEELNAHFTATGEVPSSGVRIEAERDSFFIK